MDGLLNIDKPEGVTSHDVVARVRRILKTRRVGHTGTLDPFATGVMVVVVGKATRLARFLDKDEKEYEAQIRFGFETETGDRTGSPRAQPQDLKSVSTGELRGTLKEFLGEIEQVPPMYSAKKVDGKKLYEHARRGETLERDPIRVTIFELELLSNAGDTANLRVVCSAGTYIRTLAEDMGRKLGIGAHLSELRRTRSGRFQLSGSVTLERIEEMTDPASALLPLGDAVSHLNEFILPLDRIGPTTSGLPTRTEPGRFSDGEGIRMTTAGNELLAVGIYEEAEGLIRPKVVLV